MSSNTQQAKPIAMMRSLPSVTPLRLSKGSLISALLIIINTQVVNPKNAFTPTTAAHEKNATFRHRCERTETVVHSPSNCTPTTRTTAAQISENNSINSVIEPIASRTRQNITGTSDIYNQLPHTLFKPTETRGASTIDNTPSNIRLHLIHRPSRFGAAAAETILRRGKDHSVVNIRDPRDTPPSIVSSRKMRRACLVNHSKWPWRRALCWG